MRNKLFSLFSALTILFLAVGFNGDDEPLKKLLSKLEKFREEYPQEKVHLHMDKPYYTIGDTIWFKAYVVYGEQNKLSGLSKILYVELINEKDSIKRSLRLPVSAGITWGDFTLSDSLNEGNYRIRAYTNWMRNFGEEYFFDKTFAVGNAFSNNVFTNTSYSYKKVGNSEKVDATILYTDLQGKPYAKKEVNYEVQLNFRNISKGKGVTDEHGKLHISFINNQPFVLKSGKINSTIKLGDKSYVNKTHPIKATSDDVDVKFFPESGQLVVGLPSKVGFKAVGADGFGASVAGFISDNKNKKIVDFETEHAGMGHFTFTPESESEYFANITYDDGSVKKLPLPKAAKQGYVLSVVNPEDTANIHIRVMASSGLIDNKEIILVAQSNNVVQFVSKAKLTTNAFSGTIPKNRFSSGIVQLTLFSSKYQPVAERLIFIRKDDQLRVNITTDKEAYAAREKVKMTLNVADPAGKPIQGSFSLAVTDLEKVPFEVNADNNILSNLLLTSDLPGYIENPNYYFTDLSPEKMKHLDDLMLTQGWRRFLWKNIITDHYPSLAFSPEKSIEISGRVMDPRGRPISGGKVTLLSTSGEGFALDTTTNADGYFRFSNLTFTSVTNFVVQAYNAKGRKNVDIDLYQVPPQMVTPNKSFPDAQVNINGSIITYLKNSQQRFDILRRFGLGKRNIILAEVKVVEKKPAVKYSSNLNGAGQADQIVRTEDLTNCLNLVQCLEGRLTGVIFRNGIPISTRGGVMNVMVDGVFTAPDFLNIIHPNDVESIEVLRNAGYLAIYGLRGGNGIIMVNTKRGERNLSAGRYARGIVSYSPQGYYIGREFYSPKYDSPEDIGKIPDLRTTIFWKPNIVTDSLGKATVEFYNAGTPTSYRAIVEGIDLSGKLGRQVYQYVVR